MSAPTEPDTDPVVGRLLDGRYRLDRVLARGGMATVYLATDTRLERVVAVKVMHRSLADDPDFVARFAREARSAARLSTPEVVAVHDQGRDAGTGTAYLVMEYVAGRTVRDLVRDSAALPPATALAVMEPVLRALAAAHRAGIVHRDIKPENVLLGDDGQVKVADFGLARAVQTSGLTATTGVLIGTVAYLAPEQVEHGTADARSDVYAAGIVLWELLTGHPPYAADSPLSVAYRHVHDDVPAPSTVVAGLPPALDGLVVRATRRDPAARPADGAAFLAELSAVRAALPADWRAADQPTLVVPLSPAPAPAPAPVGRSGLRRLVLRRPGRGAVAALVVLLLAALLGSAAWYLGTGRYDRVPGVAGLPAPAAEARLHAAGFTVSLDPARFDETVPAGSVLAQSPAGGRRLRHHGRVHLVLSRGPDRRAVPDVSGQTLSAAGNALTQAGLVAGPVTEQFSSSVPSGQVLRTDPPAGARLRPGTSVALVVSKGVELLPVPDERGRPQAEAVSVLRAAGFLATTTGVFSDTVPNGTVVDQAPAGGTAPRGATVALQVSKGPQLVTVPDVRGESQDAAVAQLRALGLRSQVQSIPGPGIVRDQSPAPGSQVRKGTQVTLYVF